MNFQSIIDEKRSQERSLNCEGVKREWSQVMVPKDVSELIDLLRELNKQMKTFSVVSSGNNWGYGTGLPVQKTDYVIDLGKLNQIISLDDDLGIIEIQTGCTQGDVAQYLSDRTSKWMVPTTGAGPHGSVVGNALERGFGLNPVIDHFDSILSLKVLTPTGEWYESPLQSRNAHLSDLVSKWKMGPYLEGVFSQSNLGIVVSAKIQLGLQPEKVALVLAKTDKIDFSGFVSAISELRQKFPGLIGGINISNRERAELTISKQTPTYAQKLLEKILGADLKEYQAVIPVLMHHKSYSNCLKEVLRVLTKNGIEIKCFSEDTINLITKLNRFIPIPFIQSMVSRLMVLQGLISLIRGRPSTFGLQIAYAKADINIPTWNPAKDGVGLFWFAPILRLKADDLREAHQLLSEILIRHGQPVLLTFFNFDQRLVEGTVPIYFNQKDSSSREQALACLEELYSEFNKRGWAPYRYSILHMNHAYTKNEVGQRMAQALKKELDPNQLFNPGRYIEE